MCIRLGSILDFKYVFTWFYLFLSIFYCGFDGDVQNSGNSGSLLLVWAAIDKSCFCHLHCVELIPGSNC